jgi:hypothetical protein
VIGRSIRLKLTLANVALAFVSIVVIGILGLWLQQQTYRTNLRDRTIVEAELVADGLLEALERGIALPPIVARLEQVTRARVVAIGMNGQLLAGSAGQPEATENLAAHP